MEVHVDDTIIKSVRVKDHIQDLRQTFSLLMKSNMKLNPNKCAFGINLGKFLGFMVSSDIEANS